MAATVYQRLHNASLGITSGSGNNNNNNSSTSSSSHSGGHQSSGLLGHSQLARSLERILEEAHLSGELILTNRKLKDFPKTGTKFMLTDTVIADLSRNRFCELPEEITTFAFLETLLLYHNAIRSIPESVKQLSSLTYLDLRSNQLSTLPREICFLPLQVLLVSNNRLMALPDELGRLDRLTDLDASYNQLAALPARIGELRSLCALSLRSNQLMYLPRELTCLNLISLDVSNNRIASLPVEMRHMGTLVELQLENNPLTSPPASLCVRGLVHVFKFLETQATKDEKGSRAGGNYDGYTTLRRAVRHNSSGNVLETATSQRMATRLQVDSGYSTCDGLDKRWSHESKSKTDSPLHRSTLPHIAPNHSLSAELMDASLTSSSSTIVDESITLSAGGSPALGKSRSTGVSPLGSPSKRPVGESPTLEQHINYAHSRSSSNGSSPDQDDLMLDHHESSIHNGKVSDEKLNKSLSNIQTYKEYKEALKQQRNQEISSVYKQKHPNANLSPNDEELPPTSSRLTNGTAPVILPKSIMKQPSNSNGHSTNGNGLDDVVIPKKPIQKVIPSRNTELMSSQAATKMPAMTNDAGGPQTASGVDCLGYVKPHSPMKNGVLTNSNNNSKFNTSSSNGGGAGVITSVIKSPISATAKLGTVKTHRTVTWNHDIPSEKLSFTMRREFDRQREETELMSQLRSIIETRLKMTLPEDIASALTDGVILCHLANYVRPRSVASIHVPSPGVNKLTMARCRRNVDNFLEACRRIGVDEELICSCADVVPQNDERADDDYDADVYVSDSNDNSSSSNKLNGSSSNNNNNNSNSNSKMKRSRVPNALAVLRTVAALIALDANPHHQHMRYLQQQEELQCKLQQLQLLQQQQQQQKGQQFEPQIEGIEQLAGNIVAQHFEQEQLTAQTCTKQQQQMLQPKQQQQQQQQQQPLLQNHYELYENASTCYYETIINGEHVYSADDVAAGQEKRQQQQQQQQQHVAVGATCNLYELPAQQHSTVGQLLRTAKLKTYEKIKYNLLSAHGHHSFQNNNNRCMETSNTCTLQTIIESEHDVAAAGPAGHYQLINEKAFEELSTGTAQEPALEVKQQEDQQQQQQHVGKPLSKRIEFFEHNNQTANKSKVDVKGTAGIFSIYRIGEQHNEKLLIGNNSISISSSTIKLEQLKKNEAGTSLLKHDSHTLTIVLSCVFIVTFLLLVFFPLPG
ncbi:leucine-rich repeat and calponin homology domain-containing protein 3 isoform X1 [Scaptodrosophila lebanonensis]|uniref:Leucine-rich repeat and calponin homology domain-containing protein 3 isoform X1 n=1 Tax=Drosophila lebanonensis TaxID=7225 RepID=A0A6J2U3F6_DROLE|nr:leucine-rich repeat and calponin homology domain-containing protein 3 isoform X1 [Scaptodrosophila lebanonensis]